MVFVNASVLIPLARVGKLELLKSYFKEIKISDGIKKELTAFDKPGATEIERALHSWIKEEKQGALSKDSRQLSQRENISEADASTILLAREQGEILLTNDYRLHMVARTKGVETEWLTGFLLKCVSERFLTKKAARALLLGLVQAGVRLRVEVYAEVEKRIDGV